VSLKQFTELEVEHCDQFRSKLYYKCTRWPRAFARVSSNATKRPVRWLPKIYHFQSIYILLLLLYTHIFSFFFFFSLFCLFSHRELYTLLYVTLYAIHFTVHNVHDTHYTSDFTVYCSHFKLYTVHFTLHNLRSQCTPCTLHISVHNVTHTLHFTRYKSQNSHVQANRQLKPIVTDRKATAEAITFDAAWKSRI
jgi:hypothetical protein